MNSFPWTRRLSDAEDALYQAHARRCMVIRYAIKLSSKEILREQDVRSALFHLQRKVPTLRLCIRTREDAPWFRIREEEDIDFKVGVYSNYDAAHREILTHQFNTFSGPLWCAQLFPDPPETLCPMPELQVEFPHQYSLLFGILHAVTDGTSNIRICKFFLEILNDVISGKVINDDQLGQHNTFTEILKLLEEVKLELTNDEEQLKALVSFFEETQNIPIKLLEAYPSENPEIQITDSVYQDLSVDETRKFLLKCKSEGVTVNSALCTAINAAVVELLQSKGITDQKVTIPLQNIVNLRRYWKVEGENLLGTCIYPVTSVTIVQPDIINKFWDCALNFNREMKELLEHKGPIKELVTKEMTGSMDIKKFFSDNITDILNYAYTTSNLGEVMFTGEGKHVQVTHFTRCTSLKKIISIHVVHTFRGKLRYALDYGAEYLSREGAQLWCETIFKILRHVM